MFNEGFFGLVIWRFSDELRWKMVLVSAAVSRQHGLGWF